MRKTTKKGFTLMELIIVMALFSVIMVLVMSFIDPASKLMSKTSTREKTAAYVDNINEYVDKSLRYASFVRIFESRFCETSDPHAIINEKKAVQNFIDDYFDGAIDSTGAPVEGKVHVLKLLNEPENAVCASDDTKQYADLGYKDGVLVDTVYSFKAGDSKPENNAVGAKIREFGGTFPNATITGPSKDDLAVNPEHYQHYSYYYKLGFHEFIPVSNRTVTTNNPTTESGAYDASLITKADGTANLYAPASGAIPVKSSNESDFYYKELIPMRDNTGNEMVINKYSFAVTMVAYPNDSKGDNKVFAEKTYADDPSITENVAIFKSPCYMATSSMALANINTSITVNPTCVMKDQEIGGAPKASGELVQVAIYDDPFSRYKGEMPNPSQNTSNIYFIYVVPSEVYN